MSPGQLASAPRTPGVLSVWRGWRGLGCCQNSTTQLIGGGGGGGGRQREGCEHGDGWEVAETPPGSKWVEWGDRDRGSDMNETLLGNGQGRFI